jgi:predicted RNA binding protein YcfA (HicA-like mRNA interferase family)
MPSLPRINHQRAIQAFEKAGFPIVRQGKHITRTDGEHILTIPQANPISAYTMATIIKALGLTIEEFKKLL